MNIFYLSHDTTECARMHCDKHVVKMILESAQLLCTAQRLAGNTDKRLYKATHVNHPSAVWARESRHNYRWLFSLFRALMVEYLHRYGKHHKCEFLLPLLCKPPRSIPNKEFTQPTQAMPDEYKDVDSIVAYRAYYLHAKYAIAVWTSRKQPYWWKK